VKSFKYRLCPTRKQTDKLQWTLDRCRELYNAALQERRDGYAVIKNRPDFYDAHAPEHAPQSHNINYSSQAHQLPDIKDLREEYQNIHSQVLQDVLRRVEKGMQNFFRRVKKGATPGYPRFQGRDRYESFTYPQGGYSLSSDNRVCLSKIGSIKVKLHRPIEGIVKTCTLKREGAMWYVVFSCDVQRAEPLPRGDAEVGIDLGLLHFATLSDGRTIENPRYFRGGQAKLTQAQHHVSRCKHGSHRRNKARQHVGKCHRKVRNQRNDFLHQESRKLVNTYHTMVFEDLAPSNMSRAPKPKRDAQTGQYLPNGAVAKGGLNKSIRDAGWATFVQMCTYKAEEAGRTVVQVNPRYTSQLCSGCGTVKKKELSTRWHSCECGTELDRDHNAAINILRLGRSRQSAMAVEAPAF
jgi:putative transposase